MNAITSSGVIWGKTNNTAVLPGLDALGDAPECDAQLKNDILLIIVLQLIVDWKEEIGLLMLSLDFRSISFATYIDSQIVNGRNLKTESLL